MNQYFDQVDAAIVTGRRIDAFNDPMSRLCVRNWKSGIRDQLTGGTILSRVHSRQAKIEAGEVVPFRQARFKNGVVPLGRDLAVPPHLDGEIILPKYSFGTPWLIAGGTGHGKSVLEANLALNLGKVDAKTWQICLFKDDLLGQLPRFKNAGLNLVVLRSEDLKFNPLQAGSNDPLAHLTAATTRLAEFLDLPPRAGMLLRGICHELYREFGIFNGQRERWPNLPRAYEKARTEKGLNIPARDALMDRLGSNLESIPSRCRAWLKGWLPTDLAKNSVLFLLRRAAEAMKWFLLDSLIDHVFQHQIECGVVNRELELFIFADDAQALVNAQGRSPLGSLEKKVGTIRGGGISIGFLPQTHQGISPHLLSNINGWVMGRTVEYEARMALARNMGLNEAQTEFVRQNLQRGEFVGMLADGDYHEPFLFKSDNVDLSHNVTEANILASQTSLQSLPVIPDVEFQRWERHPLLELQSEPPPTVFTPAETRLHKLVTTEPGKPAGHYTRKLGMNGKAARMARERLVKLGLLREHKVQLNPRGKASLVLLPGPDTREATTTEAI